MCVCVSISFILHNIYNVQDVYIVRIIYTINIYICVCMCVSISFILHNIYN